MKGWVDKVLRCLGPDRSVERGEERVWAGSWRASKMAVGRTTRGWASNKSLSVIECGEIKQQWCVLLNFKMIPWWNDLFFRKRLLHASLVFEEICSIKEERWYPGWGRWRPEGGDEEVWHMDIWEFLESRDSEQEVSDQVAVMDSFRRRSRSSGRADFLPYVDGAETSSFQFLILEKQIVLKGRRIGGYQCDRHLGKYMLQIIPLYFLSFNLDHACIASPFLQCTNLPFLVSRFFFFLVCYLLCLILYHFTSHSTAYNRKSIIIMA